MSAELKTSDSSKSEGSDGPRKVYIETFGCQMNIADTELMHGVLHDAGYTQADHADKADVVLLNTCAIREKAEERIYGRASQLLRYKYENPNLVIGITGCMAEHLKGSIGERAPYVDVVAGPDAYRRLPSLLEQAGDGDPIIDVRLDKRETYEGLPPSRREGVSGWVTIQRGCDKFCTFCIVPFVRGRERGASPREVLRQVRDLAAMGYREVNLLGQTVNSYRYEDVDFADLLRLVTTVEGIDRVRYTSPYPVDFTPKLIQTLAEQDKVCNSLHLPLQSGSNRVLSAMKRGYTVEDFLRITDDLRAAIPDIAISTDIIVGFPGETEEEMQATLDVVERVGFDYAYMFAYSEREGTFASKRMPDTLSEPEKKARLQRLITLQKSISKAKYAAHVGETHTVLVEGPGRRGPERWMGRTEGYKLALFEPPDQVAPGDFVDVVIETATDHTLYGRAVAHRPRVNAAKA